MWRVTRRVEEVSLYFYFRKTIKPTTRAAMDAKSTAAAARTDGVDGSLGAADACAANPTATAPPTPKATATPPIHPTIAAPSHKRCSA
jgi:hypothetical protein